MPKRSVAIPPDAESVSVTEAEQLYSGQWVLMAVTAMDERRAPQAGKVVGHGSRADVHRLLARIAADGRPPDSILYLFATGPTIVRRAVSAEQAGGRSRP